MTRIYSLFPIHVELYKLGRDPSSSFSADPIDDGLFHWQVPSGTLYSGGVFYLDIRLPSDYPFKPSKYTGEVYNKNLLSEYFCTTGICQLLRDPKPECDLMPKISKINRNRYKATVREWTRKYVSETL
ncbi:unnamed protein product [Rhizophagus irregularis]|nr:unnamed protein product [Rhizophagus irregularis]